MDREGRNGSVVWLVGGCCICIGFAVTIGLLIAVLVEVGDCTPDTPAVEAIAGLSTAAAAGGSSRLKAAQSIAGNAKPQAQQKRDVFAAPNLAPSAKNFAHVMAAAEEVDEMPELVEPKAAPKKAGLSLAEQARARAAAQKA